MKDPQIKRVFMSVVDKTDIDVFARALSEEFGAQILSTGATACFLTEAGVPVTTFDDVAKLVEAVDMVVVNLGVFDEMVADAAEFGAGIEAIDVDGSSALRSAAKNHESVTVVTDPESYESILAEMRENEGATTLTTRRRLALDAFRVTGAYDTAVSIWLAGKLDGAEQFPEKMNIQLLKQQDLRYGENPHQTAAFYRRSTATAHSLANAKQLNGKPLSYNNLLDTDACWSIMREFTDEPVVIIMKHQNPCGSASGSTIVEAFDRAFACDTKSAFGGIVAANRIVTAEMIEHINENELFLEVIIAPGFEEGALELLHEKPNLRVLATGGIDAPTFNLEFRSIDGGMIVQDVDVAAEEPEAFMVPTKRKPTVKEMDDLLFAWRVVKGMRSNAVLVAKDHAGIGIGPGQPNSVDSCAIACTRAGDACKGAVAASDAFFPFKDNVSTLASFGISAIIQPGGSIRDEESIELCDELGIAMVFTGYRHFRH